MSRGIPTKQGKLLRQKLLKSKNEEMLEMLETAYRLVTGYDLT